MSARGYTIIGTHTSNKVIAYIYQKRNGHQKHN